MEVLEPISRTILIPCIICKVSEFGPHHAEKLSILSIRYLMIAINRDTYKGEKYRYYYSMCYNRNLEHSM